MVTRTAIVMATYNEAANIGGILENLSDFDVFVVDDNSPDGTGEIAERYRHARLISRARKMGIASAYQEGWRQALRTTPEYHHIVQMDAGNTHAPVDVWQLLSTAGCHHAGLVIGSRFCNGIRWRGARTGISIGAAWLMRRIGVSVHDATSGFRCWRRDVLEAIYNYPQAYGFAFQLEMLWHAAQLETKIVEYPIDYTLTNSSFNVQMVQEALAVYLRLVKATFMSR
jgi:dolichol-phosphate mannosyltransferase